MPIVPTSFSHLVSDAADLVLGRGCLACSALGPEVCTACLARLRSTSQVRTVLPRHGIPVVAATPYSGLAQRLVLAYKEDGHRSLAAPLGLLLSDAIEGAIRDAGAQAVVIVPVPGHRRPARGFRALDAIVAASRTHLRGRGNDVAIVPALRSRIDYPAAKHLSRQERHDHLAGAFQIASPAAGRSLKRHPGSVIVVDDVVTTGATIDEAVRALAEAGIHTHAIATVAAAIG